VNNPWKLVSLALAVALGATLLTGAADRTEEKQPHMRGALNHLNQALDQLQKATADKGGHRVKAIGLTRSAIAEVNAGIAADNRR
jgi:hypothetical protein